MIDPRDQPAQPAVGRAAVLVAAAVALGVLPALVAGAVAAELLRGRGLRWTWWPLPAAAGALAGALIVAAHAPALGQRVAGGETDAVLGGLLVALGGLWLAGVPGAALGWHLWRDRRDRLHGGGAERAARAARGPMDVVRARRAGARERATGRRSQDGVLLGTDVAGRPLRLPMPRAHVTIVGGSNSGKTNTAALLLEAQAAGGGFVVLDGKGGLELPRLAVALGARHRRPVALSTALRHPKQPLLELPPSPVELSVPRLGDERVRPGDEDLTKAGPIGERIVVSGRVTDTDGRPLPDTLVEVWQANSAGRYRHRWDRWDAPLDPNFHGAGRCLTDADGRYRFVTIKPGAYPWGNHHNAWRPAHVHFSLFGRAFTQRLVTQMYFPGDPLFGLDPIFDSVRDERARQQLVSRFDIETTHPNWALSYVFDIVLGATPVEDA